MTSTALTVSAFYLAVVAHERYAWTPRSWRQVGVVACLVAGGLFSTGPMIAWLPPPVAFLSGIATVVAAFYFGISVARFEVTRRVRR